MNKYPIYYYHGINIDTKEELGPLTINQVKALGHCHRKIKAHLNGKRAHHHRIKWTRTLSTSI